MNTAIAHETRTQASETIKLRMQGTKEKLSWFMSLLGDLQEIEIISSSEPFSNTGTKRYFRIYADVMKKEGGKDE